MTAIGATGPSGPAAPPTGGTDSTAGTAAELARRFAIGSVVLLVVVQAVVVACTPGGGAVLAGMVGAVAVAFGVHAAVSERVSIVPALLIGALPVLALLADGAPGWVIGPMGVGLFASAELHALAWDHRGTGAVEGLADRRLRELGQVAAVGLVAVALVAVVDLAPSPGGTLAVVLAGAALAALALVTLRRTA